MRLFEQLPETVARIAGDWAGVALMPFLSDALEGERVELLGGVDLESLPWDAAPRVAPDQTEEPIVCAKRSRTRCVLTFLVDGPDGKPARVYAKRYLRRNLIKRLVSLGRQSKCRREWALGRGLLERGVATAVPLLWAECRLGGLLARDYLVTLGIEETLSFREVWNDLPVGEPRHEWIGALARFIRRGHDQGFAHDDLSAKHVLVERGAPADAAELYFIDLDQSRFLERVSDYRRAHNFFQVFRSLVKPGFDAADRDAFYRAYFGEEWRRERSEECDRVVESIRKRKGGAKRSKR